MPSPEDTPERRPVCATAYDSVSVHDVEVLVDLLDEARYRRVCFEPVVGPPVRFFHHTHEQVRARD
ncbi:hypothetical protein [Halomarina litorea]|uniref:hypothetical protein n=1 Tax=Halomarina litorea TaxID=2961595 RepID=UPI0020C508CD|nr:hypothetical protein [Halomarina sp. BCD28]